MEGGAGMAWHQIDQEPGDQEAAGPLSGGLSRRGLIKGILGLGSAALLSVPTRKVWALDQSMMGGGRGARCRVMITDECAVIGDYPAFPVTFGDTEWTLQKYDVFISDRTVMWVSAEKDGVLIARPLGVDYKGDGSLDYVLPTYTIDGLARGRG